VVEEPLDQPAALFVGVVVVQQPLGGVLHGGEPGAGVGGVRSGAPVVAVEHRLDGLALPLKD